MQISKKQFKEGYMLPASMLVVSVMVIVVSSLINRTDFLTSSQYKEDNYLKSETLARMGLEHITFLLRNLASESANNSTSRICNFIPRIGGSGECDVTNTMNPTVASMSTDPFSDWVELPATINSPDSFTDDESDANMCGISGSYNGQGSWPANLIRNLATTFYIPGSDNPGGGNIARSQALLQSINLGVFEDIELNPGDEGFTLESWVFLTDDSYLSDAHWPRIFDLGNPTPTHNRGNSNILLAWQGSTERLVTHYFQPTANPNCNCPNDNNNKARIDGNDGILFPARIWVHAFVTVKKDMIRLGMTCNTDSMNTGINDAWLASDAPDTSDVALTTLSARCNSGDTIYREFANPTDAQSKKIVPVTLDANGWTDWGSDATVNRRPNKGVPYTSNFLGRSNWEQDSFTQGYFHNTRVWSRALTKDEIQDNIQNDLNGTPLTVSSAGNNSAILDDPFLKSSARMSPRYDHGTHFLRYFTVMDNENPNNINNANFPFTFRVMSCSWSKEDSTQALSTFSSQLRYGVADDGRGVITNIKRY